MSAASDTAARGGARPEGSTDVDVQGVLGSPVRRAMSDVVTALAPETSLVAAARLFTERHIGGAPVVDREGRAVGVVSLTDLAGRGARHSDREGASTFYVMLRGQSELLGAFPDLDAAPGAGVVADVMTRRLVAVAPDAPLREAISLMVEHDIHRVLVVEAGRLVGLLSSMDVLRALAPRTAPVATSGF